MKNLFSYITTIQKNCFLSSQKFQMLSLWSIFGSIYNLIIKIFRRNKFYKNNIILIDKIKSQGQIFKIKMKNII